jgi:hypothetical protein
VTAQHYKIESECGLWCTPNWNVLIIDEHHYLLNLQTVGERLYYVATDTRGQWLALPAFSASATP